MMDLLIKILFIFLILKTINGKNVINNIPNQFKTFPDDRFEINSPHNIIKQLDKSIIQNTKNFTNNQYMDDTLFQLSKKIVSSILSILEIQDKITRITKEALDATGKNKRITAIENRRILDYISKTLSNNILQVTKESTEFELHHLVYGLAQIATETSIVSALKDSTFTAILLKKQSIDLPMKKKRSVKKQSLDEAMGLSVLPKPTDKSIIYDAILNKTKLQNNDDITSLNINGISLPNSPYDLISNNKKSFIQVVNTKSLPVFNNKGFLNKTVLDMENKASETINDTSTILLDNGVNVTMQPSQKLDVTTFYDDSGLIEEIADPVGTGLELESNQETVLDDNKKNEKKTKLKLDHLESRAKKAIMYAGDIAFLTASSVVAMRKALTASIEVKMSVMLAKNEMSNHRELMMNLAKTAAQQVGKEAKIAASKSLSCEKIMKLAMKYTAQSNGAILNHVANRIVLNTLPLSTLAKSMAFVSTDIAINSLYIATDVKPLNN